MTRSGLIAITTVLLSPNLPDVLRIAHLPGMVHALIEPWR
jgi:hypothetical protein